MDLQGGGYGDQLVAVLSAAADVLADLPARVTRLTGADLDAVLPVVDRLAALAGAGRYTVTADADQRGHRNRIPGSYDRACAVDLAAGDDP